MHLRDLADHFEKELRSQGHTFPFENADGSIDIEYINNEMEMDPLEEQITTKAADSMQ
jgi:hypothetical protein